MAGTIRICTQRSCEGQVVGGALTLRAPFVGVVLERPPSDRPSILRLLESKDTDGTSR